jgi:hypothetical protein
MGKERGGKEGRQRNGPVLCLAKVLGTAPNTVYSELGI